MSIEVNAARAGSTVLYIADHMDEARAILATESERDAPDIASIRTYNGGEQIRYKNGGRIIFTSSRNQGHRGYSAEVVSVSAARHKDDGWMSSVLPCMATHQHARLVIRAA